MTHWESYYEKNYLPRKTQRNVYWRGINRMTLNGSTLKKVLKQVDTTKIMITGSSLNHESVVTLSFRTVSWHDYKITRKYFHEFLKYY